MAGHHRSALRRKSMFIKSPRLYTLFCNTHARTCIDLHTHIHLSVCTVSTCVTFACTDTVIDSCSRQSTFSGRVWELWDALLLLKSFHFSLFPDRLVTDWSCASALSRPGLTHSTCVKWPPRQRTHQASKEKPLCDVSVFRLRDVNQRKRHSTATLKSSMKDRIVPLRSVELEPFQKHPVMATEWPDLSLR